MENNLSSFTDVLGDEIPNSQPMSLPSTIESESRIDIEEYATHSLPKKGQGQVGNFRSIEEIDPKYRHVFIHSYFNLVQSGVIDDALYSDKSMVVCAPTGSGKTVIFEMAIVQLLMNIDDKNDDFKIIYMAPVKALCTERLTEWYSKFNKFGLLCIEVTGDTDVDFSQLQPYKIIITTPEKWDILTRRWRDHRGLVEMVKLFLIDEVHILNDDVRGPVLEAVVSRMKTIESSAQSAHRIEKLQRQYQMSTDTNENLPSKTTSPPRIRFVAVSATVSNPEDVAAWLGKEDKPAVFYKFGDECRPVKINRIVEGYPCPDGTSIFKFDIVLNYKLWPIIQKYHDGKPTLIFCNTRKSVLLTAEALSREITITFNPEQRAKLTALVSTIKNKKLQSLLLSGVGCHHAGMLFEERFNIELAFRNRDLPILITTTTLAMGVNLPAHLVIVKNTQQYVNGAYQEYSISTVLQMLGRAGRPQFDTEATAVIMTRQRDKARYQSLVEGTEPLQSYLHKRLAENLNSEAALGTVGDVAQCVQWLRSTFLYVRAAKDPKRYLGLTPAAPNHLISMKIEEMCVRAMNGLASSGLISMDEASCITSTEAGRLMSVFYLDLETMKLIMKIQGDENLEQLLLIICQSHELADMHLRVDERRCLNSLNRNNTTATIRYPMKGKINSRQMKLNCIIQAVLSCLPIPDPSLNQEAMKIMRITKRICKCLVSYVTRPQLIAEQRQYFAAILNSIILAKCVEAHMWENSPYVSKQLKGIGPTFSTLLATAGKRNFTLLEESHPRDLERIMNKGPPAGNVLRKQISLLPKYQLQATPMDEKTVAIQLLLLNQAYLSENMDELTAGEAHKCYVIAGDSKNRLLLLKTFKDSDLISLYNGTMNFEITRKEDFEYKIFIHCISLTFVGIDVQCEYTFMNLISSIPPVFDSSVAYHRNKVTPKKESGKTELKERKRKNVNDEITQSKEKKKRENALAEKIRLLKDSFSKTSNQIKIDQKETENLSGRALNDLVQTSRPNLLQNKVTDAKNDLNYNVDIEYKDLDSNFNDPDIDAFMHSENIDNILKDIETEIMVNNTNSFKTDHKFIEKQVSDKRHLGISKPITKDRKIILASKDPYYKFIDLLERNMELSEDDSETQKKENGFSEAIKTQLDKYLQLSRNTCLAEDPKIKDVYEENDLKNSQCNTVINNTLNDKPIGDNQGENVMEPNVYTDEIHYNITSISVPDFCNKVKEKLHSDISSSMSSKGKSSENNYSMDNTGQEENAKNTKATTELRSHLDLYNKQQKAYLSSAPSYKTTQLETNVFCKDTVNQDITIENILKKPNNIEKYVQFQGHEYSTACVIPKKYEPGNDNNNKDKQQFVDVMEDNKVDSETQSESLLCKLSNVQKLPNVNAKKSNKKHVENSIPPKLMLQSLNARNETLLNKHKNIAFNKSTIASAQSSIISPPYFSHEKAGPCNKDPTNHETNKYKNIYNFSTEKVDVLSQFTAEHEIRIIRRLKIDLDVTETVLEQKLNTNSSSTSNRKEIILSNEVQKYDSGNKSVTPNTLYDKTNGSHNHRHNSQLISKQDNDQYEEKSNEINTTIERDQNDYQQNNCTETNINVETLLQKYSKTLSKTGYNLKPLSNQHTSIYNNKKEKPIKSNKPFKIADILNVNVQMNNLCDPPKDTNNQEDFKMQTNANNDIQELPLSSNNFGAIQSEDFECKEYDYTQCSSVLSHESVDLIEDDFNLDHAMLNPKKFLKYYNNDEYNNSEIIPPPPEFSDYGNIYSPKFQDDTDIRLRNYDTNNDYYAPGFDNMFRETSHKAEVDLTPSKEIETWTLSNDSGSENNYFNIKPRQSYTTVHKVPIENNMKQGIRQEKLSQFKFPCKGKLKVIK